MELLAATHTFKESPQRSLSFLQKLLSSKETTKYFSKMFGRGKLSRNLSSIKANLWKQINNGSEFWVSTANSVDILHVFELKLVVDNWIDILGMGKLNIAVSISH